MLPIDREGHFRVHLVEWWLDKAPSGAVAVACKFRVKEEWANEAWVSWEDYEEHAAYGRWWIIKKDESINETAVKQLRQNLGWNGTLDLEELPERCAVSIRVESDHYEGRTSYRATWMEPWDADPTGRGLEKGVAEELETRFGSLLRAAASSVAAPQDDMPF